MEIIVKLQNTNQRVFEQASECFDEKVNKNRSNTFHGVICLFDT